MLKRMKMACNNANATSPQSDCMQARAALLLLPRMLPAPQKSQQRAAQLRSS